MKICKRCNENKELVEYPRNHVGGYKRVCRECLAKSYKKPEKPTKCKRCGIIIKKDFNFPHIDVGGYCHECAYIIDEQSRGSNWIRKK